MLHLYYVTPCRAERCSPALADPPETLAPWPLHTAGRVPSLRLCAFLCIASVVVWAVPESSKFFRTMGKRTNYLRATDPLASDSSFESKADGAAAGLPSRSKVLLVLLLLAPLVPVRRALSSPPVACRLGGSGASPRATRSSYCRRVLPWLPPAVLVLAGVEAAPSSVQPLVAPPAASG